MQLLEIRKRGVSGWRSRSGDAGQGRPVHTVRSEFFASCLHDEEYGY